jgi:uncharacterized RDD family membrane protein YckC
MSQASATAGASVHYGGFWIRVLAYIVDGIILNIVFWVLALIFGVGMFDQMMMGDAAAMGEMSGAMGLLQLMGLAIFLVYGAGFNSSNLQATPGKLLVRLKVTDDAGGKLSFPRALGREAAKIVSTLILLIGFLMVAFTDRKRGLHDMIASTLVTYRM